MTSARCPACGAAVAVGAPWCTLCYTDLRPKPAEPTPASPPAAVAEAAVAPEPMATGEPAAVAAPAGGRHRRTPVDLLDPRLDRPVMTHADAVAPLPAAPATGQVPARTGGVWPCLSCGHAVPIEEPVCTECGAAFLAGAADVLAAGVSLPVVGDVRKLSTAGRVALMAGGAVALMVLMLIGSALLGHFL